MQYIFVELLWVLKKGEMADLCLLVLYPGPGDVGVEDRAFCNISDTGWI
jgi:hypothetical protein